MPAPTPDPFQASHRLRGVRPSLAVLALALFLVALGARPLPAQDSSRDSGTETALLAARLAIADGNDARAEEVLLDMLGRGVDVASACRAYHILVGVRLRLDNPDAALEDCSYLAVLEPTGGLAAVDRARVLSYLERHEQAARAAGEALARLPNEPTATIPNLGALRAYAHRLRSWWLAEQGNHAEAFLELDAALEEQPADTNLLVAHGELALELGRPEEARRDYDAAARNDRDAPEPLNSRARLNFLTGAYEDGLRDAERACVLAVDSPELFDARIARGLNLLALGRVADGRDQFYLAFLEADDANPTQRAYAALYHRAAGAIGQATFPDAVVDFIRANARRDADWPLPLLRAVSTRSIPALHSLGARGGTQWAETYAFVAFELARRGYGDAARVFTGWAQHTNAPASLARALAIARFGALSEQPLFPHEGHGDRDREHGRDRDGGADGDDGDANNNDDDDGDDDDGNRDGDDLGETLLAEAQEAYANGETERVIELARRAIEDGVTEAGQVVAHHLCALAYLRDGDIDRAEEAVRRERSIDRQHGLATGLPEHDAALCHHARGNLTAAANAAAFALVRLPSFGRGTPLPPEVAHVRIAMHRIRAEYAATIEVDYARALNEIVAARRDAPDDAGLALLHAELATGVGLFDVAREQVADLAERGPADLRVRAHIALARCDSREGDAAAAREHMLAAQESLEGNGNAKTAGPWYGAAGVVALGSGEPARAREALARAVALAVDSGDRAALAVAALWLRVAGGFDADGSGFGRDLSERWRAGPGGPAIAHGDRPGLRTLEGSLLHAVSAVSTDRAEASHAQLPPPHVVIALGARGAPLGRAAARVWWCALELLYAAELARMGETEAARRLAGWSAAADLPMRDEPQVAAALLAHLTPQDNDSDDGD